MQRNETNVILSMEGLIYVLSANTSYHQNSATHL